MAPELLGKYLVRKIGGRTIALKITDVEAYVGSEDKASHARFGRTARNAPMFSAGGVWYVYLIYGNHWLLNIVTGKKGKPEAILLRGAETIAGPGRLTDALKVTGAFSGKPASRLAGLWIEDREEKARQALIKRLPRVSVDYAGPVWSKKLYRFVLSE